jgi:outer membrane protein assembly factor BamB
VFALGSVLVHAARGKGPFDSDSPYVVAYQVVHDEPDLSDVPEELAPLIRDCLAKDPADRPTPDALMALARREGWHPALPLGPVQGGAESSTMWLRSWAEAETESGDGDGDEEEDEDGAGAGGESGSGERPAPAPAPAGAAHGQRRWARWAAAGAAVAVLAGGGFAVVRHLPGGEPGRPTATAQDAVRAWEAEVPGAQGADKTAVRTAACAYDAVGPALYCVDRGVKAARMDPATGKAVWSRPGTRTATGQAPVVSGGLVLIVSSDGTGLEALAPGTGRTRWTADLAPYGGYRYITKDTVLLVAPSGMVTALDSATGKPRWAEAVPGHARPIFTAYGDTAYARTLSDDGTHTLVTAVATRTGNVRWTHSFEGDLLPVGTSGGTLYLTRNGVSGAITAVVRYDPASTAETSTELPYPVPGASATVADGVVYMLGNDGAVLAVGPHGVKWQLQTSVNSPSQPVAAERRLYFGAGNGRLTAVDLTRGAFLGQTPLRLDAGRRGYLVDLQPPIVAGNRVFAYTPNGTIFCTDPRKLTG